jgi:hypothetical protein
MIKKYFCLIFLIAFLYSCSNKLDVNGTWQDITIVYGLLNQNNDTTFFRITKAFLGPGDALEFARIPDSSNYPGKLDVRLEEWEITSPYDSTLKKTYTVDTLTKHDKEAGDSVFYFPYQKVYYTTAKLNEKYIYKLIINQPKSGKIVSGRTALIGPMTITSPNSGSKAAILPQKGIPLEFLSSKNGRRYQLVLRFNYTESSSEDTLHVEWQVFNDVKAASLDGDEPINPNYTGDGLYSALKSKIPYNPNITRHAISVDYIISVGTDDLNTYMNVTAPSQTIVQERPSFTDITNGIGLFTAIYDNSKDKGSIRHLAVGTVMLDSLRSNYNTFNLGF